MAAIRLQAACEGLVEAIERAKELDIQANYGSFLYEVRCLKANIVKYTESKPMLENVDLYSIPL